MWDGLRFNIAMGRDGSRGVSSLGESGGVGCSVGLNDRCPSGSLCSRFNGIATCRGDSHCFPILIGGCDSFQRGPPSQVNSLCFSNNRVVRIGAGHGARRDGGAAGGSGSSLGEGSFRFPVNGTYWVSFHLGGVG